MRSKRPAGKGRRSPGREASGSDTAASRHAPSEAARTRAKASDSPGRKVRENSQMRTPIVGIGASAGGLEALREFFRHMPSGSGLAFVIIQHLDPHHESMMVGLLSRYTPLTVEQAHEGAVVQPEHVYVIPPNAALTVERGVLHLAEPMERRRVRMPIDQFFRSLANDQKERAICIVLSGAASEGSQGLREIKAQGGMAMVQDPETAEHAGMPRNAVATGLADYVLPVAELPAALLRFVNHPYFRAGEHPGGEPPPVDELISVLSLLRTRTGYDFRGYKRNTLLRRIYRRMGLHQVEKVTNYLDLLRRDSAEAQALFRDLLVKVTSFFREPRAWEALAELAIPEVVGDDKRTGPVRAWVAACSTGMEAYSLAMLLAEEIDRREIRRNVQIFATDIDQESLDQARSGIYSADIAADVSPERLQRFFVRHGGAYGVGKRLRDMVVFAPQDLLGDPPFSRLDLVLCRNLLIYIDPDIQRKLLPLFHFALRDGGFLFLGSSESLANSEAAFETVSKKWRIFRKTPSKTGESLALPPLLSRPLPLPTVPHDARRGPGVAELANRVLAGRFAPTALVVDRKHEIVYFHGDTETYLRQPAGEPTHDLVALLRESIRGRARGAVYHAIKKREPATVEVGIRDGEGVHPVRVSAHPLDGEKGGEGLVLVTFEPLERTVQTTPAEAAPVDEDVVSQLENELSSSREELQSTVEELEASNEELMASNEEVMSINEELQSTNEELETSKEELQSINEELQSINEELSTVNAELQEKLEQLEEANNDLANLLSSTAVATVFLDTSLRIRRFTPVTAELLNLIPGDVGRPLSDIASELNDATLARDARQVLEQLAPIKAEIGTGDGRWFIRRVLPFRTNDNRIEGVTVTFVDVTDIKHTERAQARLAAIVGASTEAIVSKDLNGTVTTWNRGAEAMYGYTAEEMLGRSVDTVIPPEERERSAQAVARVARGETVRSEERRRRSDGTTIDVELSLAPILDPEGAVVSISSIARDVTATRRMMRELAESEARFRAAGELVPFGSWLCDAAGRCTFVTKPFLEATGRTLEELAGFGWLDLVPEEERASLMDTWMQCVETGEDWDYEYRFRAPDGTMRTTATKGRAVRNENGDIMLWAGFHLDITDRRRLEDDLRRLNRELECRVAARTAEAEERTAQLRALALELSQSEQRERAHLAQVLHDGVQQLVTGAKLRLKLAVDATEDDEARSDLQEARDLLDEALRASQELILELAPPQVQDASLPAALGWLADRVRGRFSIEVEVAAEDDLPETSLEQRRLILRVVRELLLNVAKHAGVSRAHVHAGVNGEFLEVEVADEGAGFKPGQAEHGSGGYGLLSVREQLRLVQGELIIDTAPGKGTRARVRLPPSTPESSPPAGKAAARTGSDASVGNRVRVMVVDDDTALRQGLATLLGLEPAIDVIALAASGEEGIALARRLLPDVVVMDVSMKGMNGIEATRRIKAEVPDITVFGLSIFDDRRVEQDLRSAGASSYFLKGRDHERLIAAILAHPVLEGGSEG